MLEVIMEGIFTNNNNIKYLTTKVNTPDRLL